MRQDHLNARVAPGLPQFSPYQPLESAQYGGVNDMASGLVVGRQEEKPVGRQVARCCCWACAGVCSIIVPVLLGFVVVLFGTLDRFQAWNLEHPGNVVGALYQPYLDVIEGLWSMNPLYLDSQRLQYGNTFTVSGEVVLGDYQSVQTALTSPQGRTTFLGASPLIRDWLPARDNGHELTFLLAISDEGAGGNGDHRAFKNALDDVWFTHASAGRQGDRTAQQLVDSLAAEYVEALQQGEEALQQFFFTPERGLMQFHIRYLHYVLLGLDPNNEQNNEHFTKIYYSIGGPSHFFEIIGRFQQPGLLKELYHQTVEHYVASPAFADFPEFEAKYNRITKRELAQLMTSILCIAGMQGPLHLARTAMGGQPLPDYLGAKVEGLAPPSTIDVPSKWDQLELDDDDAVELYLLELGRLFTPVSASHRVATEPFTVWVAGQERTFPTGTRVNIPMAMASLDAELWGATRYDFDPQREGLKKNSMAFHSVGDRSAGRICPGKGLAIIMLTDILRAAGEARRKLLNGGSASFAA